MGVVVGMSYYGLTNQDLLATALNSNKIVLRYFLPPSFPYYYLYFHCINGSGADPEILEGGMAGHQLQTLPAAF